MLPTKALNASKENMLFTDIRVVEFFPSPDLPID